MIPVTKMFVRQKPGSGDSNRRRREAAEQLLPPLPPHVELGEVGESQSQIEIVSGSGEVTGSCDTDNVCECVGGYSSG